MKLGTPTFFNMHSNIYIFKFGIGSYKKPFFLFITFYINTILRNLFKKKHDAVNKNFNTIKTNTLSTFETRIHININSTYVDSPQSLVFLRNLEILQFLSIIICYNVKY